MIETEESGHPILKAPAKFELLDGEAYHKVLLQKIPKAKKRIVLTAIIVLWDEKTSAIFAEIEKALVRGVRVHILLDIYSATRFPYQGAGMSAAERRLKIQKTFVVLAELQKQGARVTRFGKIGINPYRGRCHVKMSIIDDDCYSFGGINFWSRGFEHADYMLYARSPAIADYLEQLAGRIGSQKPPLPDDEIALDEHTSILFDGGKPKHSIIYDRACQLAAKATKVYLVSQYVPSGRLGLLVRGRSHELYYNQPYQFVSPTSWAQAFDEQKHRTKNRYTGERFIHAKFILFEMPDGERQVITGSNNFSYHGVAFGTQEIALYSTDSGLWEQLYTFLEQHIKHPEP